MVWFWKNRANAIGVDLNGDSLKLVQLANNGKGVNLVAGRIANRPENVQPGSASWQRWAMGAITEAMSSGRFRGKDVVAAIPASDVFIDNIKISTPFTKPPSGASGKKKADDEVPPAVFSKIKQKLPFQADNGMVRYIPTEDDNALVIATERTIIDRHLAIYEKAGLNIKSICVWPVALANCYIRFFGRRKVDLRTVIMLLDIEAHCTNVVICRHRNLLFARSIPIGAQQLGDEKILTRLVLELNACRRHFSSMHPSTRIERLVFLSGSAVDENVYRTMAKQLEMQAQVGDCLAAVELESLYTSGVDRRDSRVNWAIAFGLSLS